MKVFQIRQKIYLLQNIPVSQIQEKIAAYIDKGFMQQEDFMRMHEENCYKYYCLDLPYPLEKDKVYKSGKIYTLTIRTIDEKLARYFSKICVNQYTAEIKGLTAEIWIIPKKFISSVYTLTPVILKDERGYWRSFMKPEEFEERLKVNLIKKWNQFHGQKLDENFELYTMLEFLNEGPIPVEYKGIRLLGDKICLQIAYNPTAQNLAYMALGTGLLENNARGNGFINYRWL